MKSVLIIGMGTLGRHLARKITEFGNEVLIMDENEEVIQELAQEFPNAVTGDCTSEGVLRSVGVNNFDYCFVTVGEDFYDTGFDTDVYSMTQTNEYTYKLTIKPFNQKLRMAFYFKEIDNPSNMMPSVVLIGCGKEISEETKDMLEKYY